MFSKYPVYDPIPFLASWTRTFTCISTEEHQNIFTFSTLRIEHFNLTMASKYTGAMPQVTKEVRIVMVGKTGSGKSASGNTILGRESFESVMSPESITDECCKAKATVDGQDVAIIDTPGLFDTSKDKDTVSRNISQCISYASPGPHVFLIVIALGRFTEEEMETVQQIQIMFGEAADRYSMVLFTRGDGLKGTTIEEFIKKSPQLQELVGRCHGQYHVFNNELKTDPQVTELLQKIRNIAKKNGGSHYTNEMFQAAERKIEEEKQRVLKEKEAEMRREKEQLKKEMQAEFDKKLENIMEKERQERERQERERQEREKMMHQQQQQQREAERMRIEKQQREQAARWEKEKAEIKAQNEREWKERERDLDERHDREARIIAENRNPVKKVLDGIVDGVVDAVTAPFKAVGNWIGSFFD